MCGGFFVMITGLYNLGKFYLESENKDKKELIITTNQKIDFVLNCELILNNNELSYNQWFQVEYDPEDCLKYLYRKGASRGTNITPSTLIGNNIKGTWDNKFVKWFKNNMEYSPLIKGICILLEEKYEVIFNDLNILYESVKNDSKNNIMLSLSIIVDGEHCYLNDFKEFQDIIIGESEKSYYHSKAAKLDVRGDGVCYCCDDFKPVYGLSLSNGLGLKFATPEKIGNIPGNDLAEYWKTTPICGDCTLTLMAGLKYVEKYLNFSEYGLKYYIVPKLLFDDKFTFGMLNRKIKEISSLESSNNLNLLENKLSRTVRGLEDNIEFKFIFYRKKNSALDILSFVESTIPSWLNKIYSTQLEISKDKFFQEDHLKVLIGDSVEGDFITFIQYMGYKPLKNDFYKRFFKDFTDSDKEYLDIVSQVLNNEKINEDYLYGIICNSLRTDFKNDSYYGLVKDFIKSLMLLRLLNRLELIKGDVNMGMSKEEILSNIECPDEKIAFLTGVLSRIVLSVQYAKNKSNAFSRELFDFKLDENRINIIFDKAVYKLNEYGAVYTSIMDLVSDAMDELNASGGWKLNNDKTTHWFVYGYISYKKFRNTNVKATDDFKNEYSDKVIFDE